MERAICISAGMTVVRALRPFQRAPEIYRTRAQYWSRLVSDRQLAQGNLNGEIYKPGGAA